MGKKQGKGWSEERRRKQAERCRQNKPWEHSTGPKTDAGKARTSMNAYKNGGRTAILNYTNEALRYNAKFLESLMTAMTLEKIEQKNLKKKQRRSDYGVKKNR